VGSWCVNDSTGEEWRSVFIVSALTSGVQPSRHGENTTNIAAVKRCHTAASHHANPPLILTTSFQATYQASYPKTMRLAKRIFFWTAVALVCAAILTIIAGQLGAFKGTAPGDLGVKNGRLKPPSLTPNSVSSQAALYPDHPQLAYAQIPAIVLSGNARPNMAVVASAVQGLEGCQITKQDTPQDASYVYAQCRSAWLGFVDDLELWDNPDQQRLEVRSASRLGRKDLGVNRARVEALRARLGGFASDVKK
jgi:uncharacterized protein (DUF1499 family)